LGSGGEGVKVRRPVLRYHGGKWRIAPWIIEQFPEHRVYVEPFGGGGSVLLRKAPAFIDVYNDINGEVVNFFRVLRERPEELIAAIDLTPYSREEFALAQEPGGNEVERARRVYVWGWQGRGRAGVKEPGGWRFMSRDTRGQTPVDDWNNWGHLWGVVRRWKEVQIENDDALKIIKRYDGMVTLFYVDPPYVQDSRGSRWAQAAYEFEYTDEEHRKLGVVLHEVEGMVVLSGYHSALYDELFGDWRRVERECHKGNGAEATEVLWLNERAWEERLPLFRL